MYFANVLVTVNLLSVCGIFGQQFRGDVCTVKSSGKKGLCKFITDCAEAIAGLQKGKIPDICGFEGSQSIVCCPGGQERTPGDIANKKCKEYSQYVWQVDLNPVLLVGAPDIKRNECPFDKQELIVGGERASRREFPHMAALGFGEFTNKQWLCGGSLITEDYVITAAHCISTPTLGEVRYVKLGNINLNQDTSNTQEFNVVKRAKHPDYQTEYQYSDIALLQLDRPVKITEYVCPICLFSSADFEDKNLIATGWGITEDGATSLDLKKVGLELFSQTECQQAYDVVEKKYLPLGIQENSQVCAGSKSQRKDTCQGDSGGPLQIRKNNRWYLIGITSFGIRCGSVNTPGVYTRVAYFLQWIKDVVWNK